MQRPHGHWAGPAPGDLFRCSFFKWPTELGDPQSFDWDNLEKMADLLRAIKNLRFQFTGQLPNTIVIVANKPLRSIHREWATRFFKNVDGFYYSREPVANTILVIARNSGDN